MVCNPEAEEDEDWMIRVKGSILTAGREEKWIKLDILCSTLQWWVVSGMKNVSCEWQNLLNF